ncbi:MAG: exodeoxyribonuclease III [Candidatus Dojkabacteria bacterium]
MKIATWNINGIRSAQQQLLNFIAEYTPDILGLQETKAHPDDLDFTLKLIPGYSVDFAWCKKNKGYSGTAIYYKNELKPDNFHTTIGIDHFDIEGRYTQLDFDNFSIINGYFPFGGGTEERLQYKLAFNEAVINKVEELTKNGRQVVIMGDINICHKPIDIFNPALFVNKSPFLPAERQWISRLIKLGYTDSFRFFNNEPYQYSWWPYTDPARVSGVGYRIDYILTPQILDSALVEAKILKNVYGSDHCPVIVELHPANL